MKILIALALSLPLVAQPQGSISAVNQAAAISVEAANYTSVGVQIAGTWAATLQFEGSMDCVTWISVTAYAMPDPSTGLGVTSTTANGNWVARTAGLCKFRVRASAYTSGTASVIFSLSTADTSTLRAVQIDANGSVTIAPISCAGAPGNTTGPYRSLCSVPATSALWGCTNAAGCTLAADWTSAGGGSSASLAVRPCEMPIGDKGASSLALADDNDSADLCQNMYGATLTILSVECKADAGSPTVTPIITGGSATSILTGALTCGTGVFAAGTLNGTPTQIDGATIDGNITVAGGTAKYIVIRIKRTL